MERRTPDASETSPEPVAGSVSSSSSAGTGSDARSRRRRAVTRYDLLLAVIPLLFLAGGVAGAALSVSPRSTLTVAALAAAVVVGDGLFRNPPGAGTS